MDYEVILTQIGGCGRFQILAFFLLSACTFKLALEIEGLVFLGYTPTFSCAYPWNATLSNDTCRLNSTLFENHNLSSVSCSRWTYDNSVMVKTVITEFDLVCDRAYLGPLCSSLFFGGSIIGMLIGSLGDVFGRRKLLLFMAVWDTTFSILLAVVPGLEIQLVLRFLRGFSAGNYYLGLTYITEFVSPGYRMNLGSNYWILWCCGYAACAGFGKWLLDWRLIQAVSCICCIVYIPYYFVLPESPRWLILNGRKDEAVKILMTVAKWNGRQIDSNVLNDIRIKKEPSGRALDMFKSRTMTIKTLTSWLLLWCCACSYMGMSLHATFATDDIFINMVIMGLIEIPSSPFAWLFSDKVGRQKSFFLTTIISAVCLIVVPFVPGGNFKWIRLILAILGKLLLTTAYIIADIWITENFPTSIRSLGLYSSSIWSNIAFMVAPYILMLRTTAHWLPEFLLGIQCVLTLISYFILPETLGSPLLQTVKETDLFVRGKEHLIHERLKGLTEDQQQLAPLNYEEEEEESPYPILED